MFGYPTGLGALLVRTDAVTPLRKGERWKCVDSVGGEVHCWGIDVMLTPLYTLKNSMSNAQDGMYCCLILMRWHCQFKP